MATHCFPKVQLCTEGKSLKDVILEDEHFDAPMFAFSQYPRPSLEPQKDSDDPIREDIK